LVSAFFVINQIPTSNLLLTYAIIGASSSLATASTELENLRSSYQELETKLKEAELKREQAEKQLAEKNSEHIREKGELELKKNADSETIRRQQKELNGLRKFMKTAEQHWDLLNENILGTETRTLPRYLFRRFTLCSKLCAYILTVLCRAAWVF
jgi:septal ring factor EnvC (AmiA/AmiB activator)